MSQGGLPRYVLLEDANDVADFLEATGRTIPRQRWADESRWAAERKDLERLF